ncbi:MAG: DMT family transporter [Bacteroidales bacterium]|nr:DMT family transporter [Bacteroidales bacterium]
MKHDKKALLLALAAVLCWSTIGSAFRLTLDYLLPHQLIFYTVITAFLFTGVYILIQGGWKRLFRYTPRQYAYSAITAFINPFVYYLLLLHAYTILPTQVAGTINYIWPIVLVLLSAVVLKQKIGFKSMIACLISFSGLVLIVTRGNFSTLSHGDPVGVGLILCGSIMFAGYWILNMRDSREESDKLILTYFFTILYLIPVQCIMPGSWALIPLKGVAGAVYIGIFEMGLTFLLWLKALKFSTNTARISNLVFLAPFMSLFFISIFVGEQIAFTTFVGLILIIVGIILSQTKTNNASST